VTDLRSALALATGVDIAPGADQGPAASVPEFWGLKEFDAFLLVVDGVPWGGTFNPALETLSLVDVERIEILRGAAPVMYGTTSFVASTPPSTSTSPSRASGTTAQGSSAATRSSGTAGP
jgi:outer membrane cobalamin receptor